MQTLSESWTGCNPFKEVSDDDPNCGCGLKEVITPEEESILARMREIKEQVRPVAGKLREVQAFIGKRTDQSPEFAGIFAQIEELRREWKEWEKKLQEAGDRKMIMLGHRAPH